MKTLIAFASSRGTTERAANILAENLAGKIEIVDLKKSSNIDLTTYDSVIIGGSIHAGTMQGKVKKFIENNLNLLTSKHLGIFICCMEDGDKAKVQFENAFPLELRDKAMATGIFGGELMFSKMNFIERLIVKKVSGVASDVSRFDEGLIKNFASEFNTKLD